MRAAVAIWRKRDTVDRTATRIHARSAFVYTLGGLQSPPVIRPVTRELRWTLYLVSALLSLAGISTLVLANQTEDLFAWTIMPPLTAAFMGGGYWASVTLILLAARARYWAHARIAIPSTLVFATLVLIATFLHFDRFHEDHPIMVAWVGIYIIVPPIIGLFAARAALAPGSDPPRVAPLPRWARAAILVQTPMLPLGAALYLVPEDVDGVWPWPLTPLTARVVAAFLIGLGLGAAHSLIEGDWLRLRPAAATAALFGLLQLLNVTRYSGTFDWDDIRTWIYLLGLAYLLAFGLEALRRGTLASRA